MSRRVRRARRESRCSCASQSRIIPAYRNRHLRFRIVGAARLSLRLGVRCVVVALARSRTALRENGARSEARRHTRNRRQRSRVSRRIRSVLHRDPADATKRSASLISNGRRRDRSRSPTGARRSSAPACSELLASSAACGRSITPRTRTSTCSTPTRVTSRGSNGSATNCTPRSEG